MKANEESETLWGAAKKYKIFIIVNLMGVLAYLFICLLGVPEMTSLLWYFGPMEGLLWMIFILMIFADMGWLLWNLWYEKWASVFVIIFVLFAWLYGILFNRPIVGFFLKYLFGYSELEQ